MDMLGEQWIVRYAAILDNETERVGASQEIIPRERTMGFLLSTKNMSGVKIHWEVGRICPKRDTFPLFTCFQNGGLSDRILNERSFRKKIQYVFNTPESHLSTPIQEFFCAI